jgi:hypothetical protein
MQNKIHWLSPGDNSSDLKVLLDSNLASTRLRTAVACQYLLKNNFEVTYGDTIINNPSLIIIGKIGSNADRFEYWVKQLDKYKKSGARIYLDYTDNHLGFNSIMRKYYEALIKLSDQLIVPSAKMKDNVKNYWFGPISIIPDAIEVPFYLPKDKISLTINLLWFGHASNIEYLVKYVQKTSLIYNDKYHLTVMSNANGLDLFVKYLKINTNIKNIDLLDWTKDSMSEVALKSDISLIPSAKDDPRKSGVSSNRLLTSLALGLPTLATSMPSYDEYKRYFLDIDVFSIDLMIENLNIQKLLVVEAQKHFLNAYSIENIGKLWLNFIKHN